MALRFVGEAAAQRGFWWMEEDGGGGRAAPRINALFHFHETEIRNQGHIFTATKTRKNSDFLQM